MRRSTIVMLIVLVLLAGLYWYMQQPDNVIQRTTQPTTTATAVDLGYIVAPEKGPASQIFIERSDGKSISLDKSVGIWLLLTADGSVPAEPTATDSAATAVTALRILSKLEPAPDLATVELDQPAYTLSLLLANGTSLKFNVGAKTVTQAGYYVQTADGSIYVVGAYNIDTLVELIDNPPYLQTPTPSPLPATATPIPSSTPAPSATLEPTISPTPTP